MNTFLRLGRLHQPAGIFLLLLPCWWGIALAARNSLTFSENVRLLLIFAAGATIMRGAGCTLNDLIDRRIDRQVSRTRSRPLAGGEVPPSRAMLFFILQCLMGAGILLHLPARCWIFAPPALGLLALYPYMKRITHWPQLVLGLAFNIGVFFGATAVLPFSLVNWPALLCLYAAGIAWTVGYDTIYALQDKADDLKIGVRSTAILFGRDVKTALCICYGLMFALLGAACFLASFLAAGGIACLLALGAAALLTALKLINFSPVNPKTFAKAFKDNIYLGLLVWIALLCLNL